MVLFLDYDGVVNTPMWECNPTKGTYVCRYGHSGDGKVNNYQAVQWISELCQKCDIDIVVTSTWRMSDNYKECLINGGLRPGINIIGKTEMALYRESEIMQYLTDHPEIGNDFIIIDDDTIDMSPFGYVNNEHFIKCNSYVGFGYTEYRKAEYLVQRLVAQPISSHDTNENN